MNASNGDVVNSFIVLNLPFNQHSTLEVRPGVLTRDAISRILEKRKITPQMCKVRCGPLPTDDQIDLAMDLESLARTLKRNELWVHCDFMDVLITLNHKISRCSFMKMKECDVCRKRVFWGYRCELCLFKFHEKCSSKVPTYCDLMNQIPYNQEIANRLKEVMGKIGGPNVEIAKDILESLQTVAPQQSPSGSSSRINDVRLLDSTDSASGSFNPYPRDRSSSAPNINAIRDDEMVEQQVRNISRNCHPPGLQSSASSSGIASSNMISSKAGWRGQAFRHKRTHTGGSTSPGPGLSATNNRLHPHFPTASSSNSPTSTSSSPPPHAVFPTTPSHLTLTPPQSAPPDKMNSQSFFRDRMRSKSPGDTSALAVNGETAAPPRGTLTPDSEPRSTITRKREMRPVEDWEICENYTIFGDKIGSGSYGTVFQGNWFGPVAVKKLNVCEPSPAQLQAFKNEVAVLKKIRHANVLLFMGFIRNPFLGIVTQWCEGSSLYRHIHVNEPKVEFSMAHIIEISKQIGQGMNYLHSKCIIHRDLKSNNIFLTYDNTVKIGDFGLATVKSKWSAGTQHQQPTGSILWMAPEVIRMKDANPFSTYSDVYSYGIVLYELLSSSLPYSHMRDKDAIFFMVGLGKLKPDMSKIRPDAPKTFQALLEQCIQFSRADRKEFPQILVDLDRISQKMPKLTKSQSEPLLHSRRGRQDIVYSAASPNTPKLSHNFLY
uniref:Raf homolog serine/threonine-protein kinase n=1 Tax=Steinernema glaseri TaxID=37863 RepID=A0A1I7YVJ5_9BILA